MNNSKIRWVARTAIFMALLLVLQYTTKAAGQFVTGSAVNFILIASTLLGGFTSGLTIAALSPFFAFFMGIGSPIFPVVFAIAVGNIVLVAIWAVVAKKIKGNPMVAYIAAVVLSSLGKFATLYFGIVKLVLPVFLSNIPQKQAAAMAATFGTPQLITALIGGAIAIAILPPVKKALDKSEKRG